MDPKEKSIRNQFALENRRNRNALKVERFKHSQARVTVIKQIASFLINMFRFAKRPKPNNPIRGSQQSRWDVKLFGEQASARRMLQAQYKYSISGRK